MQYLLTAVFSVLVFNFLVATVVVLRRSRGGGWLLLLLLSGTTGAGLAVVLGMLVGYLSERSIDVALVFAALASLSAVVAVAALSGRGDSVPTGAGADDAD